MHWFYLIIDISYGTIRLQKDLLKGHMPTENLG